MQKLLSENGSFVYKVFKVLKMKGLVVVSMLNQKPTVEFRFGVHIQCRP